MSRRRKAKAPARKAPARLPGDPADAAAIARMIRVDHAGEYGAARIYDGQLAVLKGKAAVVAVRRMAAQEKRHLEKFDALVADRRVRPTALSPLWHAAGYALGAATALLGERAAMACTVAVEETIDDHYRHQLEALGDREPDLAATIADFRADEIEHRDIALEHGAREAPGYPLLAAAIKAGSRLAIWLSTRV
ncbi:MAG: demethoxyubiquinone hydroxylase family protein [Alphaproteobacteria bacterium]|nr:demethoxyubiquinone hydroxylase family protein [Alphaproteobacteria bacterium]